MNTKVESALRKENRVRKAAGGRAGEILSAHYLQLIPAGKVAKKGRGLRTRK
jgi:hypothetical protein